MVEMTLGEVKRICKELQLYSTPHINDKLYLHYKGWSSIGECLGEYTGLKSLWLEGNGLSKIENLDKLTLLRCLFLNNNLISEIEGLEANTDLDTLNLANNQVAGIAPGSIASLTVLSTLHLASNKLKHVEDLSGLLDCPSISVLDISNNDIEDPAIVELLEAMPNLRVLHLSGNPCVRKITSYRKTLVSRLKQLRYLDDRPVFDDERRCTEAWAVGGMEAEKTERVLIREEKAAKEEANRAAFRKMLADAKSRRQNSDGNETEAIDDTEVQRRSAAVAEGEDWQYDVDQSQWTNTTTGQRLDEDMARVSEAHEADAVPPLEDKDGRPEVPVATRNAPPSRYSTDDIFGEEEPWERKETPMQEERDGAAPSNITEETTLGPASSTAAALKLLQEDLAEIEESGIQQGVTDMDELD
jgi:hypothetical protein